MAKISGTSVKKKTPVKKRVAKKSNAKAKAASPSLESKPKKKLFARTPRPLKPPLKLPRVIDLVKTTGVVLWQNWELFLGITVTYGLLSLILVQGLANSTDISNLKSSLDKTVHGHTGSAVTSIGGFVTLIASGSNGGSSPDGGAYQLFLGIIASLAIIWTLRQVMSGNTVRRIRDAYYQGMYPLIPFTLVLLVIVIQLIPLIIGAGLYTLVVTNGIAIGIVEKLIFGIFFALMACVSFYLVSSSIFALYIVTLPDMTPLKAIRSARTLVSFRRLSVIVKLLALPVILLVITAVIILPVIALLTPITQWVFFVLSVFALLAIHSYLYTLYRELLK